MLRRKGNSKLETRNSKLSWALGLALALLLGAGTRADEVVGTLKVQRSSHTGLASFVTAADGETIAVQAAAGRAAPTPMDFLIEHGGLFGMTNPTAQLIVHKTESDALGYTHTTYRQVHQGVRVFGGTLKVHQNAAGEVTAANGDYFPSAHKLSTTPGVTAEAAQGIAAAAIDKGHPQVEKSELVIVDPGWYGDVPTGPRLAHYLVLVDPEVPIREGLFVDALNGTVLDQWTMIHTARNRRIHDGNELPSDCCRALSGAGCDDEDCAESICGFDAYCCDVQWDNTCAWYSYFACPSLCQLPGPLVRTEGSPAIVGADDVNAAYDYYGDTYDYFFRGFGRDSIDNRGMAMVAAVNSYAPFCPNAYWDGAKMVFCPGLVTDDIVAHELTHGVTQHTADLIYQNQPGQLNESFSDVFGELVDLFNGDAAFVDTNGVPPLWPPHPTGPGRDLSNKRRVDLGACNYGMSYPDGARWMVGEDAENFGGAIRDMWRPPCFGSPDRANSELQNCLYGGDSGGVHYGSGVPNHAFAMITDGKTFNGYTVAGIGSIKSGAIWYRALTEYLTEFSDFRDAYAGMNQAASDLVGASPNDPRTGSPSSSAFTAADAAELDKALKAVEMNTVGNCGATRDVIDDAPPSACPSGKPAIFSEDFENGASLWAVETLGQPTTPNEWQLKSSGLPKGRPGKAIYCRDVPSPCADEDETATHLLYSPPIQMPSPLTAPVLSFLHYLNTEVGYDAGHVEMVVSATPPTRTDWDNSFKVRKFARADFIHNPYNTVLYTSTGSGWSGLGGWGTSIAVLPTSGQYSVVGKWVQFRFQFSKDYCYGIDGWYVDDVNVFDCDCNNNGVRDDLDVAGGTSADCQSNGVPDECDGGCAPPPPPGGGGGGGGEVDQCPSNPSKTAPGQCGCDTADTDTDGDGTADCLDNCPNDAGKTNPEICGCGTSDVDTDGDGIPDCNDQCPNARNEDSDGDGVLDCEDLCPADPDKSTPGECGCGQSDVDGDGDGVPDCRDLCPEDKDKSSPGACGCGRAETDSDADGVPDCVDASPGGMPEGLIVDGPAEVLVGETAKFTALLQYPDGTTDDVSELATWRVMDTVLRNGGLFQGDRVAADGMLTVSDEREAPTTLSVIASFADGDRTLQGTHQVAVVFPEEDGPTQPTPVDGGAGNDNPGVRPGQGAGTAGGGAPCAIGLVGPMSFALLGLGLIKRRLRFRR